MPAARAAAARRAAQGGTAAPLAAASLVGVGAGAGLAAQLGREGEHPAAREAGRATEDARVGSAGSVVLAAVGASGGCATRRRES